MKSILLIILTVNFGFFLIASQGSTSTPALEITNLNVKPLCLVGDKPTPDCNIAAIEGRASTPTRSTQSTVRGTTAARPPKRMATAPVGSTVSKKPPTKLASLGSPKINPTNPAPNSLNTPRPKGKVQCFSLGPFIDSDDAFNLNGQLKILDVQSVMRTVKEKEKFWVYLQDYRETDRTVAALRGKGVKTFEIITRKGKRDVVSIGWFKNHASATRKYKKLASLGFTPKLIVKGSPGEQVWVDYYLREGAKLPQAARKVIKQARAESYFQEQLCK